MVKPARRTLIVEGGGDHNQALKVECRRAFSELQRRAGLSGRLCRVEVCGGRLRAYEQFCRALREAGPGDVVVLLVDSEEVVTAATRWEHVRGRQGDGWERPSGAGEEHLFFMSVVMETWLLADPSALAATFGAAVDLSRLPAWPALEQVPKDRVYAALRDATGHGRGSYDKGKHSFKVLERVNPVTLAARCPSAAALFDRLRA